MSAVVATSTAQELPGVSTAMNGSAMTVILTIVLTIIHDIINQYIKHYIKCHDNYHINCHINYHIKYHTNIKLLYQVSLLLCLEP
jgi:hypothetical protein